MHCRLMFNIRRSIPGQSIKKGYLCALNGKTNTLSHSTGLAGFLYGYYLRAAIANMKNSYKNISISKKCIREIKNLIFAHKERPNYSGNSNKRHIQIMGIEIKIPMPLGLSRTDGHGYLTSQMTITDREKYVPEHRLRQHWPAEVTRHCASC
jgi:hypothetical protein